MIPLIEINAISENLQIPIDTVEKDYVICWLLRCLSRSELAKNFTFYGGTAIKRIYFEEHRFSEDIDLTSHQRFESDYIFSELDCLQYAKQQANIEFTIIPERIESRNDRIQLFIAYTGFDEIVGPPKQIKVDFTMNRSAFGEIADKKIIPSYSDLKFEYGTLKVMTLNTILANKFGMLADSTRNEPRDIFDIWFLLKRAQEFDCDQGKILDFYKQKYGFRPAIQTLRSGLHKKSFEQSWLMRLSKQVANLPPLPFVISEIEYCLQSWDRS